MKNKNKYLFMKLNYTIFNFLNTDKMLDLKQKKYVFLFVYISLRHTNYQWLLYTSVTLRKLTNNKHISTI